MQSSDCRNCIGIKLCLLFTVYNLYLKDIWHFYIFLIILYYMRFLHKNIKKERKSMNEKKEFKPYIPADKVMPELTVTSVIIGVLLAILFGGANAYLGLRVGMTVSAS